jgi:hypothetical protein
MTQRKAFWIAFGLLIVVAIAIGGLGDKSLGVTYQNETGQTVIVYPYGRNYPAVKRVLGAGGKQTDNLLGDPQSTTQVARIEAVDESGNLIYCQSFIFGELGANGGVIHIRLGESNC